MEDQILSTCPLDPTKLQILEGLRTTLQDAAAATNVNINVAQCLLDEVFAPGLMSRAVLLDALAEVGALTEDMRALTTVEEFSAAITAWVDSVAGDHQAGAMGAWAAVLHAYARAFRRRHLPIGLLQETAHREEQALMLVCSHGAVSTVRMAQAVELAAANLWPKQWDRVHTAVADGAGAVLHASSAMVDACGGKAMLSMLRACYLHGMPLSEAIAAALRFLTSGDVAAGADDAVAREWRAQCRTLPLVLSDHLAGASEGLAYAVDSLLGLLSQQLIPLVGNRKRSPLTSVSRPLAMAALAHGHQAASSQLDCLLGAMMLVSGVLSGQPGTAQWRAGDRDIRHLAGPVSERLGAMLAAAGVAYWSVTTLGPSATSDPAASSDPSSLVVSLRLGGGAERMNSPASGPNKRARLTPWQHTSYVAEHLFPAFKSSGHAVRDVLDVQSVASAFARWMLCVPGVRALDPAAPALPASIATARALDLAAALLQARAHASLKQLLAAVPHGVGDDPCLQFFAACATALAISEAAPGERRRLEEDSVATFFKVATLFPNRTFFGEQLKTVSAALRHLGIEPAGGGPSEMDEAQYYETLMGLYSRLGCAWGASRFALAAVKHVASPSEDQEMDDETVQRTSRLWSAVFAFCLEAGEYDEAYAALLGNDVAEQQVECVHRLVKDLCDRGDIATLCALPFANNGIEVHKGRWVSLLDEAVLALRRRAEAADLDAVPQPYKVLFDFHVARGNYQSAATAMLTYARRLTAERTSEPTASDEAHRALGAAVGALGLVRPEQAWVEDPILEDLQQPRVLTLRDLRKEHAVARARAAVSTVGAGTTLTSSSAPEDILDQLLTLGARMRVFALLDPN